MSIRRGFTLIELLVVVAIIAVLISILLPSLGRAKQNAVRTKCLAVLKQWGTVINTYSQENNGVFVIKLNGQGWNSTGSSTVDGSYATQWVSRFNKTLRVCPGSSPAAVAANTTVYCMVSYNPTDLNVFWNTPGAGGSSTGYKLNSFRAAADTVLMCDTAPPPGNPWFSSMSDFQMRSPNLENALNDRHNGTGGVLFVDAHAETHPLADYGQNIPSTSYKTTTMSGMAPSELAKPWARIESVN
jgi:prepilin-type N-terminal cleavage/methylation domain-containing protein/prepilin-type processing-associated H-X9-DG protein